MNSELSGNKVKCIISGNNNDIWVGLNNEWINRIQDGKIYKYNIPLNKEKKNIETSSFYFDKKNGTLWISTDEDVYTFKNNFFREWINNHPTALNDEQIAAKKLIKSKDGNFWIASIFGIMKMKDHNFIYWSARDDDFNPRTEAIFENQDGSEYPYQCVGEDSSNNYPLYLKRDIEKRCQGNIDDQKPCRREHIADNSSPNGIHRMCREKDRS